MYAVQPAYRLFSIDGDETLTLIPLCARRALDALGLKLSLDAWQQLALADRRSLAEAGSGDRVDRTRALNVLAPLDLPQTRAVIEADPSDAAPPEDVVAALGSERPLVGAVWSALSPLERWVLAKVARRGHRDRIAQAYDEIVGHSRNSVHLRADGSVRMVDVSQKVVTERQATAQSRISLTPSAFAQLVRGNTPKGDVLSTARLAAIMAAKRTHELIPLCHSISLSSVSVECTPEADSSSVAIVARAMAADRTGVEMEALVAASVAALTIYDMMKAFDRGMTIGPTRLVNKTGGKSGDFTYDVSG
jgi:cyclic pyranopterin phosphate synthase